MRGPHTTRQNAPQLHGATDRVTLCDPQTAVARRHTNPKPRRVPFLGSATDVRLASVNSDMIRWGRVLLSHTPDAARSY